MKRTTKCLKWLVLLNAFSLGVQALAAGNSGPLVPVAQIAPHIRQELRYASRNNFTHQIVYRFHQCFLLPEVAKALGEVQAELEKKSLGLKVWDCYRPMSAQKRFWEIMPDPRYVSPPAKGGLHTRGTAVDLTLVNALGQEQEMPTGFDDFSPRAARKAPGATKKASQNSQILETAMQHHGFVGLATEWWHFDFASWQQHAPLQIEVPEN